MKAFIINFNQLSSPKAMYYDFIKYGLEPVIVDNNSTYKPLLDWYNKEGIQVIRLSEDHGHTAVWTEGLLEGINDYYIVTDPDLDISTLPDDWIEKLKEQFHKRNNAKAGLALRIDDVPDTEYGILFKGWESKFWVRQLEPDVYDSPIDTTLALYHTSRNPQAHGFFTAIRLGGAYQVRHIPSYYTPENLKYENVYYIQTANKGTSTSSRYSENLVRDYMGGYNPELLGPIDVVIPTRNRLDNIQSSWNQLCNDPRLRIIYSCGDEDSYNLSISLEGKADKLVVMDNSEYKTAVTGTNNGFKNSISDWVVVSQDDILYHKDWVDIAFSYISPEIKIVGFNDGDKPHENAEHSVTWLVNKEYFGDNIFYPGYKKNFADNELNDKYHHLGLFKYAKEAITEHLHWSYNKTTKDPVYNIGEEFISEDHRIYHQRREEWLK